MSQLSRFLRVLALCALLASSSWAQSGYDRVLHLDPPLSTSCLAVEIPTPDGAGLTGLRWWHNDAQVAFPKLVLLEGEPGAGPDLENAALILLEIAGASLSWGEVDFGGAVTSSTGTAYAIFYYPEAVPNTGLGNGKGPGIGIKAESGAAFYLSGDAEHWVRFDSAYAIGIEPVYAQGKAEPRVLAQMKAEIVEQPKDEGTPTYTTELLSPKPNPFNPRVEIAFTLARPGQVELVIYDLRGRLIATLLSESKAVGTYSVLWEGRDDRGREVASGTYFARIESGKISAQKRLVLLR